MSPKARRLTSPPNYPPLFSLCRIDARQIVSLAKQLGKHSDGGVGYMALCGKPCPCLPLSFLKKSLSALGQQLLLSPP